jgi:predicted TIM-barrel fold metal-dependent hydrolase
MTSTAQEFEDLFLPEPAPRAVKYTVISVDDHLVEPAHMFEGRVPAKFADQAPRVVEDEEGHQSWRFDGKNYDEVGVSASVGRKRGYKLEPFRFDQMRRGCWDIEARVSDMDINGVWASVNFPSFITGFCGRVFAQCSDPELGLAVTRAWNDWLFEEWYSPHKDRIIPLGITFLTDPAVAAAEIRRNAERGFRSVSMPERPHAIGLPSLFSGYWDPVIAACAETGTVISLHVGSSGGYPSPADAPRGTGFALSTTLFGQLSLAACTEWLYSGYPMKHPELKIAMSEGGIGWVPMLIDRLDNMIDRSGYAKGEELGLEMAHTWTTRPAEVLRRNFSFCTIDDPSTIELRHIIGVENIMVETDYPHGDGTWPDTQAVIEKVWGHIPDNELRAMCCENAARVFRHPLPETVLP